MPHPLDEALNRIACVGKGRDGDRRLAAMLHQDAAHFSGLSSRECERVRGEVLATFEGRDLPPEALRSIAEELRTSLSPVVLAGAARALAGAARPPADMRPLLEGARDRIAGRDEYVSLGNAAGAATGARTAGEELRDAILRFGEGPVRCCGGASAAAPRPDEPPLSLCAKSLRPVTVEDQSRERTSLVTLLRERASLLLFFYTRCMNPAKCSLAVGRLGALARHLAEGRTPDFNVLAVSYDPAYDRPERLLKYGLDRDFPFAPRARLMRCAAGWSRLRSALNLRVGYGPATVNDHARELFFVSPGLGARAVDPELLADASTAAAALRDFADAAPD